MDNGFIIENLVGRFDLRTIDAAGDFHDDPEACAYVGKALPSLK